LKIYDLNGKYLNEYSFENKDKNFWGPRIKEVAYKNDLLYYFEQVKVDKAYVSMLRKTDQNLDTLRNKQ